MARARLFLRQIGPLAAAARSARRVLGRLHILSPTADPTPGLAHVRSGVLVIELGDFEGEFELDARSHLLRRIIRDGSFEPECARAVREHLPTDRDAIDIGANAGFFSVLCARHLEPDRRVIAVEPTTDASERLRRNLARNGVADRVTVVQTALSEIDGQVLLEFPPGREEYGSLALVHESVRDVPTTQELVNSERLDGLVDRLSLVPGFVKIDVEGAECKILKGAAGTLSRYRPILLLELVPDLLAAQGSSMRETQMLLASHGYSLRWLTATEALATPN